MNAPTTGAGTSYDNQSSPEQVAAFTPLAGEPNPFLPPPGGTPWQTALDLASHQSEAILAERVLARLAPWFHIEREVPGLSCGGKTLRIDAVVRPRQPERWKNPEVALGIEFKRFVPGAADVSMGDITGFTAQAIDYTHVEWNGYGRLPIFTCPGILSWIGENRRVDGINYAAEMYRRLLGQLGIGEVTVYWGYGLTFDMSGHAMWSERNGVRYGKTWSLKPRAGSR